MTATGIPCECVKKIGKWPFYKKCGQIPTTLHTVFIGKDDIGTENEHELHKKHYLCGDCVTENVHLIRN